jgi:hypothetical protein
MRTSDKTKTSPRLSLRTSASLVLLAAATLDAQSTPAEVRDIARRAYLFAYPLVMIEATAATCRSIASLTSLSSRAPIPAR